MQTKELIAKLRCHKHVTQGDGLSALQDTCEQAADALEATLWREPAKSESGRTYIVRVGDATITATRVGTHWMTRGQEIFPSAIMDLPAPPEEE